MKVLNVFPAYEPAWAFGGVVRCTSHLCRAIAKLGTDVSVYTTNVNGQGDLLAVPVGVPVDVGGVKVSYFSSTFGKNSVWDSRLLLQTLDETIEDFDIIYVSAIYQWICVAVGRIARRHRAPYIVGTHGSFHPATLAQGKLKKRLYWHLFLKRCIKDASAIHFTTKYEQETSKQFLPNTSSFVVPNSVPIRRFESPQPVDLNLRRKYGIDDKALLLLTVIRPDPVKRLDILVYAFKEIVKSIPEARLLIVGCSDNPYTQKIKKLVAELEIHENIHWLGYQTNENLNACYHQSNIFILTSEHENFSMATAEAMEAGLPVAVSNCTGIAENVKEYKAGIVTEVNADQVAQAVVNLLRKPDLLKEMCTNAKKAANELYSPERAATLMLKAFQNVVFHSQSKKCI